MIDPRFTFDKITKQSALTVGELRKIIAEIPDDVKIVGEEFAPGVKLTTTLSSEKAPKKLRKRSVALHGDKPVIHPDLQNGCLAYDTLMIQR